MTASLGMYTISCGHAIPGVAVGAYPMRRRVVIPAVVIGREGQQNRLGVLPVRLFGALYQEWADTGQLSLVAGKIRQTAAGKPRIIATTLPEHGEQAIVSLSLSLDRVRRGSRVRVCTGWTCRTEGCRASGAPECLADSCQRCGRSAGPNAGPRLTFDKHTLVTLAYGRTLRDDGEQQAMSEEIIAVVRRGTIYHIGRSDAPNAPDSRYVRWDGQQAIVAPWRHWHELLSEAS